MSVPVTTSACGDRGLPAAFLRLCLVCVLATVSACSVGGRYLVAAETRAAIASLPAASLATTAAPAQRFADGHSVFVRGSALALGATSSRSDGRSEIQARTFSGRVQLGHVLVWIGTPLSLAGLAMVIWGRDALRWSGIALSGAAEPLMIAGTVIWVRGARAQPELVEPGRSDFSYLPEPGRPSGLLR